MLKLLVVPSRYPNDFNKLQGSFYREQSLALAKLQIDVRVLAVVGYSLKEILKNRKILGTRKEYLDSGVLTVVRSVFNVPKLKRLNYFFRAVLGLSEYNKLCADWKPDIILAHSFAGGDIAGRISDRTRIPFAITEHSSKFFKKLHFYEALKAQEVFRKASRRWAVSPALANQLRQTFDLTFETMPNSVDKDMFKPGGRVRSAGDPVVFLNIGNLVPVKRTYELILAFHHARIKCSLPLKLRIVGGGPERKRLERLIVKLEEQAMIELVGTLPRDKVANIIAESDCLVVASRVETFGVVIIESLSCGVPVISTRCGGPEHILAEAPFCSLVEDVDKSLASKMIEFAERGSVDREAIRTFAVERYSAEAVARRYIEELSSIITQPK
ncbi:MAG TPA: glycosyltransferase [Spirochaetia bacterium]|nr:glycosyltransferase [Spirochaetales bacterium]HRY80426.1 glycosyltransferase [Spirochaetia bacterium]